MKKYKIIFWVTTVLIFVAEGVMSAIYGFSDMSHEGIIALGYPIFFGQAVATAKILGSLALIIPQSPHWSKEWAYAGFSYVAIFAGLTHIVVTKSFGMVVASAIVLIVVLTSRHAYYKIKNGN